MLITPKPIFGKMLNIRTLFFIFCFGFIVSIVWIELGTIQNQWYEKSLMINAIRNVGRDFKYAETYRILKRPTEDLRYILVWAEKDTEPTSTLTEGQKILIDFNCSITNCYFTKNKKFFPDGLVKFDAIAFNGRILPNKPSKLPTKRYKHQKYIYMNMESSANYPLCLKMYDNFFNMTATYKLNSDVALKYLNVKNCSGDIVGPKSDLQWIDYHSEDDNTQNIQSKSKAAAWFVSNCNDKSDRKGFADKLNKKLNEYGASIDIYGKCGNMYCPRDKEDECNRQLEKQYYFYLSLENSFAEDYVTEKLLTAVHNNVIPIVYGGADYERFLPPHSYLDGRNFTPDQLAELMIELMVDPVKYQQYFWWKKYYSYENAYNQNFCDLCAKLNDNKFMNKVTVYKNFRKWWNPKFEDYCS